ncbi:MAG: hypothetical protein FWD78_03530, partial [Treponema sp.]|nr:hypothetical protein [Treponema sp.]
MKSSKATVYFLQMLLTLLKGRISLAAALQVLCGEGIECHTRNYAITLLNMMRKGKKFSESLASIKSSRIYFNSLQLT